VIALTWNAVTGARGYRIYRDANLIAIAGQDVTKHLDFEMGGPGTYTYCIESFDLSGTSSSVCDGANLPASPVKVDPWDWFNDVFPANANPALIPASFDTTAAVIVTGNNMSTCTGATNRPVQPNDKIKITVTGSVQRVDMIFRIRPGPGNYCLVGHPASGLKTVPSDPSTSCPASPNSFWTGIATAPGPYALPNTATAIALHAAAPSGWDPNVWNSRQCVDLGNGVFQSTLSPSPTDNIIPSGILTPGSHVEYYFRVDQGGGNVINVPDPNCVIQAKGEQSIDGHRWASFSVLPDRWKDGAWAVGDRTAPAPACLLVVDLDDARGNERSWAGIADSILITAAARYGAGNGWHAVARVPGSRNPVDIDDPANNRLGNGSVGFPNENSGAPGTTWDLYNVRGAQYNCEGNAGSLGGRLGSVANGYVAPGPSAAMLRQYYRAVLILTGDRSSQILGPIADRSQDDVGILTDFLENGTAGTSMPRAVIVQGNGFAESEATGHPTFLSSEFGTSLTAPNHQVFTGTPMKYLDITLDPPLGVLGNEFGVINSPSVSNDVLGLATGSAIAVSRYGDHPAGGSPTYVSAAAVLVPSSLPSAGHASVTLLNGWNIEDMRSPQSETGYGRVGYYYELVNSLLAPLNCATYPGGAVGIQSGPGIMARSSFIKARGNPALAGSTDIELVLAEVARVRVALYDIAGRQRRTLHEGTLEAGAHVMHWDGKDQSGEAMPPGMYLVRAVDLERGILGESKLIVLR